MEPVVIICPACQAAFSFQPARGTQRVARIRCSGCDHGWIERLRPQEHNDAQAVAANIPPGPGKVVDGSLAHRQREHAVGTLGDILPTSVPLARRGRPLRREVAFTTANARHERKPHRTRSPLVAGIACSIAGVAVFAFLFAKKDFVVAKVPAAAGLYASVGAPVNYRGLQLRDVKSILADDNGQRILMVEGLITNIKNAQTSIPDMRVTVRTSAGRDVYHWVTPAPKPHLSSGETTSFRARLIAPPEEGQEIKVQFANKIDAAEKLAKEPSRKK